MNKVSINAIKQSHRWIGFVVLVLTIFVLVYPMSLNWVWDEGSWGHHGQYEKMTEAILDGHLYMDYAVDPKLLELENPYDRGAREMAGVHYEFDHAFYDGHYYMYFGVVPVFLLFVPLKLVGITLASSQGTQVFAAFAVAGFFALFDALRRKYAKKLSFASYLAFSVAASFVSLWYAVKYPALYCTAIVSGIAFAVWGLYFAVKAFVAEADSCDMSIDTDASTDTDASNPNIRKTIIYATLAALCGALVFGCRPTIGFVSLVYLPMIWHYVCTNLADMHKSDKWKMALAFCLPYIIVAILLMTYNYVRFDNPFEFGQSYQLTLVDQHQYMGESLSFGAGFWQRLWEDIKFYFVAWTPIGERFPYIHEDGFIYLFPIVLFGLVGLMPRTIKCKNVQVDDKSSLKPVKSLTVSVLITVFIIIVLQTKWSPNVLRRYAMDFGFLLMIMAFFGICRLLELVKGKATKYINGLVIVLSVLACLVCVLVFFANGESAIADVYPELIDKIEFWK